MYSERLRELQITMPTVASPKGRYLPAVRFGDLVVCSGQLPSEEGRVIATGRVGAELTVEEGYRAARQAALNCLAAICTVIDGIDSIRRIIQVRGYVNGAPGFVDFPQVINGASDLLIDIFGEHGRHARCALGASLPGNVPVEVEMMVGVKG